MNSSVAFVTKRVKDGSLRGADEINWSDANILPFITTACSCTPFLQKALKDNSFVYDFGNDNGPMSKMKIRYDPDAEYEYVTYNYCISDGTLLFSMNLIKTMIDKIIWGRTYNKQTAPDDFEENRDSYDVEYMVGDILHAIVHGNFGTEEKPWLCQKDAVAIPVAITYKKRIL